MPGHTYKDPLLELLNIETVDNTNEENNNDLLDLLPSKVEGDNDPDPPVSKSTYTYDPTKQSVVSSRKKTRGSGNYTSYNYFGNDRSVTYESNLDEKKYTRTLDNGDIVDLSLMELSDPKKNPELNQYISDKNEEFDNPDLFKPITRTKPISTGDPMDMKLGIAPTREVTYQPYEKELNKNRAFLNELSKENLLDKIPEQYRWNNDMSDDEGVLEVPQEILENYTRNETLKGGILMNGIKEQWTDVLEDMPDGVREANLLERKKRYDNADAENYVDDQDKFMLEAQVFNSDEKVKKVLSFEENVLNKDFEFENINNEKLVYLNGKPVPVSLYKDYESNFAQVKLQQSKLQDKYKDLVGRRDILQNAGVEMDLLARDYSILRKFGYVFGQGVGNLLVGAGEYLEAGVNVLRDIEALPGPGGMPVFVPIDKKGNEFDLIEKYAQKRRKDNEKMMKTFSADVEFGSNLLDINNMTRFVAEESARQGPIFATIAATGVLGAKLGITSTLGRAAFTAGGLGVMTGGQQIGDMNYQEAIMLGMDIAQFGKDLEYNNKNWGDAEKFLIGSGHGLLEGTLGTMPTALLMNRGMKLVKEVGRKNMLDKTLYEIFTRQMPKEAGIGIALEAPTEGLTQLFQNGLMIAHGDQDVDLFEGVGHATFSGGLFGGLLGSGSVAMGMAMRKFMPNEMNIDMQQRFDRLNDVKAEYARLFNQGKRGDALKEIKEQFKKEQKGINDQMIKFNEIIKRTLGDKGVYQDFIDVSKRKSDTRARANRIYANPDIDNKLKKKLIDDLALDYQRDEMILNSMLGENNPNRYLALASKDPERYNNIKEKAKLNLKKKGIELTDKKVDSEAYDLYLREEVDKDIKNTTKLIDKLNLKDKVNYTFWNNENAAKQEAADKLLKGNLTEAEQKFYKSILIAKPGKLNGISVKGKDGKYYLAGVVDTMVNNERTFTAMHELDHIIMWDALLDKNKSLDWKPMAEAIREYLKETNPSLYQKMFVIPSRQAVQRGDNFDMETVINFMERIDEINLQGNRAGNLFSYWFGQETNKVLGKEINWKNTDDVVTFIKQMATKIKSGEFTKEDLEQFRKSEIIKKYSVDQKNVNQAAKSESSAFELVEGLWDKDTWNTLSEDQKIGIAQTAGLYLENYLKTRISGIVSTEEGQDEKREIELLALVNKFIGLDTRQEDIKESFAYKRGLINLIAGQPGKKSGFDPSKNDSMMAWVNTELGNRLLEVAKGSGKFGRFEKDIDAKTSDGAPAFQIASSDISPDAIESTTEEFNKTRQILEISKENPIYDKTLNVNTYAFLNLKDDKGKTKGKTVEELLTINPRRARTIMREHAAKNLRADITNIIGAQKSQKFKDFINNEQKLQSLINLLAVKYRSSFPFLSNENGTMNVSQSKANIESDQGSFVSDTKAGNTIWTPIQLSDMSKSEKADFMNFVQKAFVDGLVTKKFADDGLIEYNGRETTHKALKDALANELMLDATFTAMKQSPDFNTRFEGNVGVLAENIKRSPEVAFSMSQDFRGLSQIDNLIEQNRLYGPNNRILKNRYEQELLARKKKIEDLNVQNSADELRAMYKKAKGENKEDIKLAIQEKFKALGPQVVEDAGIDIMTGLAFSMSDYRKAVNDGSIKKLADAVMKKGYDDVFDSDGNLQKEYKDFSEAAAEIVQSAYNLALIPDGGVARFMTEFRKNPIFSKSLKKAFEKALTSKSNLETRMNYAIQAEIFAKELGGQIIGAMTPGNDIAMLGFINRVLDAASRKVDEVATRNKKLKVARELSEKEGKEITLDDLKKRKEGKGLTVYQKGVTGDFFKFQNALKLDLRSIESDIPTDKNDPDYIDLSKVRLMNVKINNSLFSRLNKLLNNPELDAKQKRDIYERDFMQEVKDANIHNKKLFKFIVKKLVNSNITDLSKIQLLQLQTQAVEGLRALTGLKYITFTDTPIGTLKGEHLADNAGSMMDIAILSQQVKKLTDAEIDAKIDEIAEYHDQWLENRTILDKLIDAFDTNNPFKDLRILLTKPTGRLSNIFTFDLKPAETLIKQRENDIRVKQEIKKSKDITGVIEMANSLSAKPKGISVFDFDDTLARSNSKVGVTMPDGSTRKINATEFALESADLEAAGAKFDFSEFNKVIEGKKGPLADLALKRQGKFGSGDIFVLTARPQEASYAIHAFLKGIGLNIPIENITGLEDGRPEAKADWIVGKVNEGYNNFYFADDAIKNIKAVKDVLKDVDVKGRVELAFSKSEMEAKLDEIIEHQSGVKRDAQFSNIVAKRKGAEPKFYIMKSTAQDFEGLLYYMAGKGEQGSQDLIWLQDNLFKPYMKGVDAINIAKTAIVSNFKNLNKQYKEIGNNLTNLMPDGNFTYDQGIRVYIWNKQGFEIPGLSKRDLNSILKVIKNTPRLKEYADQMQIVGSGIDNIYAKPKEGWEIGSILADLDNLTNKVGRKRFLKDWLEIKDMVFTPAMMNKLQAVYGTTFREALEDSLWRMENGTNRPSGNNKITNSWLNWVNNSVGTIMFFNRRSALLQSISTINFINWSDNNPYKAALAYANQPQFWKDFAMIWNSPKLKQRRRGLKTDLQWQEIANSAKNSKNKFEAVVAYLLQIGFTPTQLVDNFAIAAGGAPYYRNRLNTYLKQGMDQKQAEQKAFEDFSEIAEKTQQSGDPALVSQEQASHMGRLVLAFQNVTQQMFRLQNKAGTMLIRRQRYKGMSQMQSDFTNVSKLIYYGAIQNFIFTFLQNAMFAFLPGFDEDEDPFKEMQKQQGKQERQINNMIDTLLKGSGIRGAVLSTIKNVIMMYQKQEKKGFTADHAFTLIELLNISPPIGSKARKIYNAHLIKKYDRDILDARGFELTGDGQLNLSPAYEIIANLASATLNLPLDRALSEVESLVEATDSRNTAWQRIALTLGWRTWDVNAKNEYEDLIEMIAKEERKMKKKSKKANKDLLDLLN